MKGVAQKPIAVEHRGQVLRGTFYEAGGMDRRRPVVVMLHGFTGTRVENDFMFVTLARELAAAGIHAAAFDFRGSGESDGTFGQMLVSGELDDALRILQWLPGRPGVDRTRIGLLGFSLGGLLAACASARSPVKALALLAPTTTQNLKRHVKADEPGPVVINSHTLHQGFFDDLDTHDPLGDVVKRPRPTLLVHGTADKAVPPRVGEQYEKAMREADVPLQVEWIEGANHTFTGPVTRRRLTQAVTEFFRQTL